MNLGKKKRLASRTLRIGKERIVFVKPRLDEIKEAITKQDIRDLKESGAILIKEKKGKRKIVKRKRKNMGNIRKKVNTRKQDYVKLTRKLRKYLSEMVKREEISKEDAIGIRKKIRNKDFRSKAYLRDYIGGLKK